MLYLDEQTKNHSVHAAARGLVGSAPQGCGTDLRRQGQRPCGVQCDAERRGRNGPDGQLVAGAVRLLESGEYRIPLNAYGLGVSYGYAWMLSKRWNIALEAGVGLYRTKDTRRDPTVGDWEDEYIYHYRRWTLAPTKLEVSFSHLF